VVGANLKLLPPERRCGHTFQGSSRVRVKIQESLRKLAELFSILLLATENDQMPGASEALGLVVGISW
jgi:hypothetical protein